MIEKKSLTPTGYTLYQQDIDGTSIKVQEEDYTPSGRAILEALARGYRNAFILTTFGRAPKKTWRTNNERQKGRLASRWLLCFL